MSKSKGEGACQDLALVTCSDNRLNFGTGIAGVFCSFILLRGTTFYVQSRCRPDVVLCTFTFVRTYGVKFTIITGN